MVRIIKLAVTLLTLLTFTRLEAADLSSLNGVWNGVWHIGMSSGKAVLRIEPSGDATIRFTNLEGFDDSDTALKKLVVDDQTISFAAPSQGSVEFTIKLSIKPDGESMEGGGKYSGAGAKLVFRRAN